jgi:Zn-dependent protease with chaperone function
MALGMEIEQQAKFDILVRQLERSARQQAKSYQLRVGLLAAIGYGYIAAICAGILSSVWLVREVVEILQRRPLSIDSNYGWLLIGFGLFATFWVNYAPLNDREITREECPELFATIDDLRDRLQTPPIHHVVVTYDYNAAIYQAPILGWLGWYRNYLILGLPLMQSLTPEQFRATLAHELGHLSGNDSRFAGWIYRVRQMWEQLTSDRHVLFYSFFRWYEPVFKAYSFVLVRDREYAADNWARKISGRETAAKDLIQTYVSYSYLEECFNRQLDLQARDRDTPPEDVVTQMLSALRQPLDSQQAKIWLGLALGETTDTEDTHPCLADRLAALGYTAPLTWEATPITHSAAEYFFADRLAEVAAELDRRWAKNRESAWLQQHHRFTYQAAYLQVLDEFATYHPLSLHTAAKRAELTAEIYGDEIALPQWEEILDRDRTHPQAHYRIGKTLVRQGLQRGEKHLEIAIALDPDLVVSSCEELYRAYIQRGDLDNADLYLQWRQQHLPKQWRSKLERQIGVTDRFVPHNLTPEFVAELRDKISHHPTIRQAYLVCKPMQIFPDYPLYVLGIDLYPTAIEEAENNRGASLAAQLDIELRWHSRLEIILLDRQPHRLNHSIRKVSGANLF